MKNLFVSVAILLYAFFQAINVAYAIEVSIFRVEDRKTISFNQMMEELKKTDVIFVGEIHDNMDHHTLQLRIINSLHNSNIPLAVGLEMFIAKDQAFLDSWVGGDLPVENFIKVYVKNWGEQWHLYGDIFYFLRNHKIPAIGLNVPEEIMAKVNRSGFSSLNAKELEDLPRGITCKVDRKYMDFIKRAHGAHENSTKFYNFCEAQLLWDKAMARHIVEYLKRHEERPVVVLAGSVHAWKEGIPRQLKDLLKGVRYKVLLPEIKGGIGPETIGTEDADYIMLEEGK